MEKFRVGIIGATGMVGQRFVLLTANHPWFTPVVLAASAHSAGKPYVEAIGEKWHMADPIPESVRSMVVMDAEADAEEIAKQVDFVFCAVNMKKDEIKALEERDHAMLMLQYLQNNDVPVTLEAVAKPDAELKANMDPLKAGLAHEQYVTSLIHAIYEAAYEARDFRTMQFLDWFVKEQGEEETNATDLIKKMELFGSDPKGLYMLDQELAARTYAAPSLTL